MAYRRQTRELGTSEARQHLPALVRQAVSHRRAANDPRANAVEIRPRGETRSASLVPTADLEATERRIEQLEEELENAGIALFLQERLAGGEGKRLSAEEFLREIEMDEFVEQLPGR